MASNITRDITREMFGPQLIRVAKASGLSQPSRTALPSVAITVRGGAVSTDCFARAPNSRAGTPQGKRVPAQFATRNGEHIRIDQDSRPVQEFGLKLAERNTGHPEWHEQGDGGQRLRRPLNIARQFLVGFPEQPLEALGPNNFHKDDRLLGEPAEESAEISMVVPSNAPLSASSTSCCSNSTESPVDPATCSIHLASSGSSTLVRAAIAAAIRLSIHSLSPSDLAR